MAQDYGMFGPSVNEVYSDLDTEYLNNAVGGRNSTAAGIGRLANTAMQGFGQAVGREDDRLQKARKIEQVKQYVQQTAKSNDMVSYYEAMSEAFKKFGLPEEAMKVDTILEKIKNERTDRELKESELSVKRALAAAKMGGKLGREMFMEIIQKNYSRATVASKNAAWAKYQATGDLDAALKLLEDPDKIRFDHVEADGSVWLRDDKAWQEASPEQRHPTIKGLVKVGTAPDRKPTTTVDARQMGNELGWIGDANTAVKRYDESLDSLEAAYELGTTKADGWRNEAITRILAKAFNSGALSNKDVEAFRNQGDVGERIANAITLGLSGRLTELSASQRKDLVMILGKKQEEMRERAISPFRQAAKRNNQPGDELFPSRKFFSSGGYSISGNSGKTQWKPSKEDLELLEKWK